MDAERVRSNLSTVLWCLPVVLDLRRTIERLVVAVQLMFSSTVKL